MAQNIFWCQRKYFCNRKIMFYAFSMNNFKKLKHFFCAFSMTIFKKLKPGPGAHFRAHGFPVPVVREGTQAPEKPTLKGWVVFGHRVAMHWTTHRVRRGQPGGHGSLNHTWDSHPTEGASGIDLPKGLEKKSMPTRF